MVGMGLDVGTEETRPVTIEAQPNHLMIHLQGEARASPATALPFGCSGKPGIGWEVTVHQKNDEFRETLIVPDNGGRITTAARGKQ